MFPGPPRAIASDDFFASDARRGSMTRRDGKRPSNRPPPPSGPAASSGPQRGRFVGRRLVAWWLDTTMLAALIGWSGVGSATGRWITGLVVIVVVDWVGVARFGATPGKALVGLRVAPVAADALGWSRAAIRTAVKQLPTVFYLVALGLLAGEVLVLTRVVNMALTIAMLGLWIYVFGSVLSDVDGRGRHDRLAGTMVQSVRGVG
ncbi:MAG: RDD family protein [Acidimicrobiales bacterium]